jgi:hypothetical protein
MTDIQIILRNMGIKGYLTINNHLVIMNPGEYLINKFCDCGRRSQEDDLCSCEK